MPEIKSPYPLAALSVIIFGHFLNHFYAYIFGASMFVIRDDIVMNNRQIGLLATIQMGVFAFFTFAVGIIGDKWLPSKKLFVPTGVFFMALHLILAAYAQTYLVLVFSSIIVGFGASFYHPVAYAAIADLYEERKGLTMALNAALGMIGTALTPGLIGTFDNWIGWRKFYQIFGWGAVIISLVLFYGFEKLISYNFTEEEINGKQERKTSMDTKERVSHWIKNELLSILILSVIICLLYSSFRSGLYKIITQFLSIIFVDYYEYDIFAAGWLSSIMLIIGGLTAILGGILSDRTRTSLTMFISLAGSMFSILLIFLLGGNLKGMWIIVLFFTFVAFLHFSSAASTKYVAENVPQQSRSTALGFLFAIPNTIAGVFPWLFGLFLDIATFQASFIYLFIISLVGTGLTAVLLWKDITGRKRLLSKEPEKEENKISSWQDI